MKKKIKIGMTNKSWVKDDLFVQKKKYTCGNHLIDYKKVNQFYFVPELIADHKDKIIWQKKNFKNREHSSKDLTIIAKQIKIVHNSKMKFPDPILQDRVKFYFDFLAKNKPELKTILNEKATVLKLLKKIKNNSNLHGDLNSLNILKTKNKIFFVDWEYASRGDYHMDLVYFMGESNLNEKQQKIFLNAYGYYDKNQLLLCKIVFNMLVVLWVNSQENKYFNDKIFIDNYFRFLKLKAL